MPYKEAAWVASSLLPLSDGAAPAVAPAVASAVVPAVVPAGAVAGKEVGGVVGGVVGERQSNSSCLCGVSSRCIPSDLPPHAKPMEARHLQALAISDNQW